MSSEGLKNKTKINISKILNNNPVMPEKESLWNPKENTRINSMKAGNEKTVSNSSNSQQNAYKRGINSNLTK